MNPISSRTIWVQGRPAHYWDGGTPTGPPLLLLHGGLGDAVLHWQHNFADLGRDFRILAPDLPGFGRTAPLPQPSYPAYAAWVAAFCETVGAEAGVIAVGNSMGAAIARVFAATCPARVARLVLVDGGRPFYIEGPLRRLFSLPPLREAAIALLQWQATARPTLRRYLADPAGLTPGERSRMVRGIRAYVRVQRAILQAPPVPPRALQPACPTLMVWGAQDGLGSPALGHSLAAEIGAAGVAIIDGAGHMPMFEQPAAFARVLRQFVAGS